MLKADLHIHSSIDPIDKIIATPKDIIDKAAEKRFNVLAFTHHRKVVFPENLVEYAKHRGILLIKGVEAQIKGREVLIYNVEQEDIVNVKSFKDLRELKKRKKNILIIAPHPFYYLPQCLRGELKKNLDLFDAIEYNYYHTDRLNANKRMLRFAKKHNIPIVGNSDVHRLWQLGYTYSLINAKLNLNSIFNAIKKGKVKVFTRPIPFSTFIFVPFFFLRSKFRKLMNGYYKR
ncbi:PHP-associated domain-containing protein [Nanoarchaeota archaeon]